MKTRLPMILFLLFIWLGFSSDVSIANVLLGGVFAIIVHFFIVPKPIDFKVSGWHLLTLSLFTLWELLISSLEVSWEIVTPTDRSQPGFITIPLSLTHPNQMSLLANIISLTPGTLAIDINVSKNEMDIHLMFMQNEKQLVALIKGYLEPKIMKVLNYEHG